MEAGSISVKGVKVKKIALLSNVNMNAAIRMLQKETEIYEAEGYGNEIGLMTDPDSSYHAFAPEITFLVMDLLELLGHELDPGAANSGMDSWFEAVENVLSGDCIYYISDAWLWGAEVEASEALTDRRELEQSWLERLKRLCGRHANVRILPYHRMLAGLGEENAFSPKMWYMGRILLSNEAQKRLCALILDRVRIESRTPKKVLLLDLDNTLWGGLAGENEHTPVVLSEDHAGLAYKNLQRVILQMQRQGVLLGIVSKNNEADAEEILCHHPHMVLKPSHFVIKKINWKPKHENILEIAQELNLGLDSFVFWDDTPAEGRLVREMLPLVTVPDFPERPEGLATAMTEIYHVYFEKPRLTAEDLDKTEQYHANERRQELSRQAGSFEDYLKRLQIVLTRVAPARHLLRLEALMNKTNQFNLTARRHDLSEIQGMLEDKGKRVFLYQVSDCFGDNGVVAAVAADVTGEVPVIEEFVMSCRVMGRRVEQGILEDVGRMMQAEGFRRLRGIYRPTAKNKPVAELYPHAGFAFVGRTRQGEDIYERELEPWEKKFCGEFRVDSRERTDDAAFVLSGTGGYGDEGKNPGID